MRYLSAFFISFWKVFSRKTYLALGAFAALAFFAALNWFPYVPLIARNLLSEKVTVFEKIFFAIDTLGIVYASGGVVMALAALAVSALFGINIAFIAYYFSLRSSLFSAREGGVGFLGILASFLGFGCFSCGSVLVSVLGLSGAVATLPFTGRELPLVSILLLTISLGAISVRIEKSGICRISP